jgi:hypothetical protein
MEKVKNFNLKEDYKRLEFEHIYKFFSLTSSKTFSIVPHILKSKY